MEKGAMKCGIKGGLAEEKGKVAVPESLKTTLIIYTTFGHGLLGL